LNDKLKFDEGMKMPIKDNKTVLLRLFELLKQLPTKGTGKTVDELTKALIDAGYKISRRQVERDLNELLEAFPLDKDDTSNPYGWKWVNGASLDFSTMTISEALSLHLVEETIKPLVPASMMEGLDARFRQADKLLAALSKENRKAKWATKVRTVTPTLPLITPVIDSTALATVQEALLADEQVDLQYRSMGDDVHTARRLSPLAMVTRGSVTYLIASKNDSEEIRTFAMHRILSATRTYESVKRTTAFNLDEYIQAGGMQFGNGKTIRLKAKVNPWLARILEETPVSTDQKFDPADDRVMITATVADSMQLTWWILSYGSNIEVISPVKLRREICEILTEGARQYE
jgi:predicted DNA-binding transcriptional regulator YafY